MKPKKLVWCPRDRDILYKPTDNFNFKFLATKRSQCCWYSKGDCELTDYKKPCIGVEGVFTPNEGGAK